MYSIFFFKKPTNPHIDQRSKIRNSKAKNCADDIPKAGFCVVPKFAYVKEENKQSKQVSKGMKYKSKRFNQFSANTYPVIYISHKSLSLNPIGI